MRTQAVVVHFHDRSAGASGKRQTLNASRTWQDLPLPALVPAYHGLILFRGGTLLLCGTLTLRLTLCTPDLQRGMGDDATARVADLCLASILECFNRYPSSSDLISGSP